MTMTHEERELLRRLSSEAGKEHYKETAKRFGGKRALEKLTAKHIRADGTQGDIGGRPKNRCAKSTEKTKRHRYKDGKCWFCGALK